MLAAYTHAAAAPDPTPAQTPSSERDARWLRDARALVSGLNKRSAPIYWTDLLLSAGGAWMFAAVYFLAPAWGATQLAALLAASVLFFRAGTFMHELVHMPPGQMVWFGRAWNVLVGVPLLMPWILYRNHMSHHNPRVFGTPDDGEYLPLASSHITETFKYLAQAPLLPLYMVVRFGVLGPLSWLHPRFREFVLTYTSAAVSNPYYRKRFPQRDERHLKIVELLCFGYLATVAALVAAGVLDGGDVFRGYALLAFTLGLNWVRNLAAHGYGNEGDRMDLVGQFRDSINVTGQTWLTALMFPVGLRYHALHHLFPRLPYHNLGKAHRLLSERLPPDAPYHASSRTNYFAVVAELWRSAWRTPRETSSIRRWHPSRRPS